MRTKILNALKVSALAVVLSVGIAYVSAASPLCAPPGCNAAAPINISSVAQSKAGNFTAPNLIDTSATAQTKTGSFTVSAAIGSAAVISGTNGGAAGTGVYGLGSTGVYGVGSIGVQGEGYGTYGVYGRADSVGVYGNGGPVGSLGGSGVGVQGVGGSIGVSGYGSGCPGYGCFGTGVYGDGGPGGYDFRGVGGEKAQGGAWVNASDRNKKENFKPVDNQSILSKIVALPMTQWNYKSDKNALHIGPVAQDFSAIFGLGSDDLSISTIDPSGVALVGVKALNEKIEAQEKRLDAQQKQIDALIAEVQALRK